MEFQTDILRLSGNLNDGDESGALSLVLLPHNSRQYFKIEECIQISNSIPLVTLS
jgi:hypothetical protein